MIFSKLLSLMKIKPFTQIQPITILTNKKSPKMIEIMLLFLNLILKNNTLKKFFKILFFLIFKVLLDTLKNKIIFFIDIFLIQ
jgi:hypothetical protein